ncbi:toxin regulator [Paenibacillaceae bacterium WGS1546]|uniref:toxin regulator n=1 Tax=Cohnella sp. WGS1546 TaxID=3366810 RepID=UPI00372D327B
MKKLFLIGFVLILTVSISACSSVAKDEYQKALDDNVKLQSDYQKALDDNAKLKSDSQKTMEELKTAEKRIDEFSLLEAKYKNLSEAEVEAQQAANELKAEQDRQAKEQLLAQEKEKAAAEAAKELAKAEAEEKKGYETGITFKQLARTPDDYEGKKVKFSGKVLQVVEGDSEVNLRVAVNSNYSNVIYVYYPSSLTKARVLEDDNVNLYGVSEGLYTYTSTMGGNITVPLIKVEKIDIK